MSTPTSDTKTANVRDRILQAGATLLDTQGVKAMTQPQIAKFAGVSQSHLTYYFPTRADLLTAIAWYSIDRVVSEPLPSLSEGDMLKRLAEQLAYLPRVRMFASLLVTAEDQAQVQAALERLLLHVRGMLHRMLVQTGHAGSEAEVLLCHATVVGLAMFNLGRQSPVSRQEIATGLHTLFALLPKVQS